MCHGGRKRHFFLKSRSMALWIFGMPMQNDLLMTITSESKSEVEFRYGMGQIARSIECISS